MRHPLLALLLALAAACGPTWAAAGKQIAITVDDLPAASAAPLTVAESARINTAILATLQRHKVTAVGFVNEDRVLVPGEIDAGVAILSAWLDAGMELGNHNYGHLGLWRSTRADVETAVLKGEVLTRWLTSQRQAPLRYYRHPFSQTGKNEADRAAFEDFLSARGYTVVPITAEFDDYFYACVIDRLEGPEAEAQRRVVGDEVDAHVRRSMAVFERMSQDLFGRQIPQILVTHSNRLNAATLDRTLTTLKSLGYEFVTVETALKDEAYRLRAAPSGRFGPSWLAQWARAKGVKLSVYGQPDPDGVSAKLHAQLCAR